MNAESNQQIGAGWHQIEGTVYQRAFLGRITEDAPFLIRAPRFTDHRGSFMEMPRPEILKLMGLPEFVQENVSASRKGALRGMHVQRVAPQGKLIHCAAGKIQDAAVDLRPGPNFGKTYTVVLGRAHEEPFDELFWIPPGFAHGFLALSDCVVLYRCSTPYAEQCDAGVDALTCGVRWFPNLTAEGMKYLRSPRDALLPKLQEFSWTG